MSSRREVREYRVYALRSGDEAFEQSVEIGPLGVKHKGKIRCRVKGTCEMGSQSLIDGAIVQLAMNFAEGCFCRLKGSKLDPRLWVVEARRINLPA